MSRATVILNSKEARNKCCRWAMALPTGTRVEFKEAKRTTDQNARFWAMATELSQQLLWHGQKLTPDDWKLVLLDGLKAELRIVPNLNGNGFVNLGRSSSGLSKAEFSDLIELMLAFGAQHGVVFSHDQEQAA